MMSIHTVFAALLVAAAPVSAQVRLLPAPKMASLGSITPAALIQPASNDNRLTVIFGGARPITPKDIENERIRRWRLPQDSLAADVVRLVTREKLISQSDRSLGEKGLLAPDGGLCNATCAATLAMAHAEAYPLTARSFGTHLDRIADVVASISSAGGKDARLGSGVHEAAAYLERLVGYEFLPDSLEVDLSHGTGIESHIHFDPGEVRIAGVTFEKNSGDGESHSILLVGIDPEERRTLVYDPNFPAALNEVDYHQSRGGVYLGVPGRRVARFEQGARVARIALRRLPQEMRERLEK
jgi:hypothetical protein